MNITNDGYRVDEKMGCGGGGWWDDDDGGGGREKSSPSLFGGACHVTGNPELR